MEEGKHAKPDYPDLDKDGDKEEPMTKAAEEAEETEEETEVQEEQHVPDKQWYSNQLHDALLKKFNIKK